MAVSERARRKQKESKSTTKTRYTHLPLGKDVEAFAGYYTPENEVRLKYRGREVLYVTGHVVVEATCSGDSCGIADTYVAANYWYAIVPGYVLKWQGERNKNGLPVTEVELIKDTETQEDIRRIILTREAVSRLDFW
jgi:hypothetical protein